MHNHFRFEEQSRAPNGLYIFFKPSTICRSGVGKRPSKRDENKHEIRVGGCESSGHVVHELMHSIGELYLLHMSSIYLLLDPCLLHNY